MVAMTIKLGFCYRKFIELVAYKGPSLGKLVIQREETLQVKITGIHNNWSNLNDIICIFTYFILLEREYLGEPLIEWLYKI